MKLALRILAVVGVVGYFLLRIYLAIERDQHRRPVDLPAGMTYVKSEDPGWKAAVDSARSNVDEFIGTLAHRTPQQSEFKLLWLAEDQRVGELLWVSQLRYEGSTFVGAVEEKPKVVKGVQVGQPVVINKDDIIDWMFMDGDELVGGYTLRYKRSRMSDEDRAEVDSRIHFRDL